MRERRNNPVLEIRHTYYSLRVSRVPLRPTDLLAASHQARICIQFARDRASYFDWVYGNREICALLQLLQGARGGWWERRNDRQCCNYGDECATSPGTYASNYNRGKPGKKRRGRFKTGGVADTIAFAVERELYCVLKTRPVITYCWFNFLLVYSSEASKSS